MFNDDNKSGRKEFDLVALLQSLTRASKWQLGLRGCIDPIECANDLAKDWTYFGRPVAKGQFLILGDKIIVFIPGAVDPEKVLHRLVVFQVQEWKRNCERCRFGPCPIVQDFDDGGDRVPLLQEIVDPANAVEMLTAQLLFEEIMAQIPNPDTRRMFEMKFRGGWTEEEIAGEFGLTQTAVHQRMYRQTLKLRSIFVPVH